MHAHEQVRACTHTYTPPPPHPHVYTLLKIFNSDIYYKYIMNITYKNYIYILIIP